MFFFSLFLLLPYKYYCKCFTPLHCDFFVVVAIAHFLFPETPSYLLSFYMRYFSLTVNEFFLCLSYPYICAYFILETSNSLFPLFLFASFPAQQYRNSCYQLATKFHLYSLKIIKTMIKCCLSCVLNFFHVLFPLRQPQ